MITSLSASAPFRETQLKSFCHLNPDRIESVSKRIPACLLLSVLGRMFDGPAFGGHSFFDFIER
jgi:hypothetical protein